MSTHNTGKEASVSEVAIVGSKRHSGWVVMVEEMLMGMMMEDPHLLGFLLSIPSPTNHNRHRSTSLLTPIAPLPSPKKSHIKFELILVMCLQVYCR